MSNLRVKAYPPNTSNINTIITTSNSITKNSILKTVADFEIGEKIGQGTFSKVFTGHHIKTGEKVAIKIINKSDFLEDSDKMQIEKEIIILKQLRHNSIIQLFCVIETEKTVSIIMEHCSGGELFEHIVSRNKILESEACVIFQQLISGVEYLHSMGIAHRDLKPENLLMKSKREIKIADFGLSNIYNKGSFLSTSCGSPCYAAPEMIKGIKYIGSTVDIWSCGIVLFTMVSGYLPFDDDNQEKLFLKIVKGNFKIPNFISSTCRDLIKGILTVDPRKRYTFQNIKNHPWFGNNQSISYLSPGLDLKENVIPLNENVIIALVEYFGFDAEEVIKDVVQNKHNSNTTAYYLLLKQRIKKGEISKDDMSPGSELFMKYMNSSKSKLKNYNYDLNNVVEEYMNIIEEMIKNKKRVSEAFGRNSSFWDNTEEEFTDYENNMLVKSRENNKNIKMNETLNISNVDKIGYREVSNNKKDVSRKYIENKVSHDVNKVENSPTIINISPNNITPILYSNIHSKDNRSHLKSPNKRVHFSGEKDISLEKKNSLKETEDMKQVNSINNIQTFNTEINEEIPEHKIQNTINKVEIDMKLDLNSGIFKNYIQSKMRKSVKEQYDKYVRKSILLNVSNNNNTLNNSSDSVINSHAFADNSRIYNNAYTNANDKVLLTTISESKRKENSLDENLSTSSFCNICLTSMNYAKSPPKRKFFNTSTISGNEVKQKTSNDERHSKSEMNKNTNKIPLIENKVSNFNVIPKTERNKSQPQSMRIATELNLNIFKNIKTNILTHHVQKNSKSTTSKTNPKPTISFLPSKKQNEIIKVEEFTRNNKLVNIFCKNNIDSMKRIIENICGKNSVTLMKNTSFAHDFKCEYKFNDSMNNDKSKKELIFYISVLRLKEIKECFVIKFNSFKGDELMIKKIHDRVKRSLTL